MFSPLGSPLRRGQQEGIRVFKELDALDGSVEICPKKLDSNTVLEKAPAATEHEDGGHFQDENMEKYVQSAGVDDKGLELVYLPDSPSPSCLGEAQLREYDCNSYPGNLVNCSSPELQGRSRAPFTRRWKRKKGKGKSRETASKKRRLSYSCCDLGLAKLNLVGCLKSAGGETKTAQSNVSGSRGSGRCRATKSKATLAPRTSRGDTNCGGTGDGGEDGEDPHKNRKPHQYNCISSKVQPVEQKAVSQFFKITWNCRLNHFAKQSNICKLSNCHKCQLVKNLLGHYEEKLKNSCSCSDCKLCPVILKFHLNNCKLPECYICLKFKHLKDDSSETNIQNTRKPVPNQACNGQCVLSAPISSVGVDQEEDKVVWKDDTLEGLTHFREHQDYVIKGDGFVGRGGHGQVHEVVLDPRHQSSYDCFAANQKFVIKKTTVKDDEIKVISNIANHPNFVQTYLIVNKKDGNFNQIILMEECDKSLREYLNEHARTGKALEMDEAMHYWTQVLDAVVHLHNLPIPVVHKDIKPGNVLLTYTTKLVRAKLADFDAVKLLHNEFTMPGLTPEGTPGFIAPEVLQRRVHGRPADIYSMGILLLELLFKKARKQPKIALQTLKEMDSDLGELIERCLQVGRNTFLMKAELIKF